MKKSLVFPLLLILILPLCSCGSGTESGAAYDSAVIASETSAQYSTVSGVENDFSPADGSYSVKFDTDSSMFHVNEVYDGRGVLSVSGEKMVIHIVMPSKNIVNLYPGTAEDAQKEGAQLLDPLIESVTYPDGTSEDVYSFDIPVPCLDKEFDCALLGKKGKWYDHKVTVSDPKKIFDDGEYTCEVTLEGGTGRAFVESPADVKIENGINTAKIIWSSTHYEYIEMGDERYDRLDGEGNSVMMIPFEFDRDIHIKALTTAMSEPHLIEYTLFFDSATLKSK